MRDYLQNRNKYRACIDGKDLISCALIAPLGAFKRLWPPGLGIGLGFCISVLATSSLPNVLEFEQMENGAFGTFFAKRVKNS